MGRFERATNAIERDTDEQIRNGEGAAQIGYKMQREGKSERLSIIIRPSVKDALDEMAAERGISRNELINIYLESAIENERG